MAVRCVKIAVWVSCVLAVLAWAEPAAGREGAERSVVLDTTGYWRLYHTLRPPVIQLDGELKPVLLSKWLDRRTPKSF